MDEAEETLSGWEDLAGIDIPRMKDEALVQFVRDFCDGKIFTSADVRSNDIRLLNTIFMPIAFGAFGERSQEFYEKIGLLWEHLSEAGPLSINRYPMFFSVRIMHKEDWERARGAINKELERRKNITL